MTYARLSVNSSFGITLFLGNTILCLSDCVAFILNKQMEKKIKLNVHAVISGTFYGVNITYSLRCFAVVGTWSCVLKLALCNLKCKSD